MADTCHGNGEDHCCYLAGEVCPFLEVDTVPGRHWVCGLRREHGNWEDVHKDERYLEIVKPVWEKYGVDDCGDFKGGRLPNGDVHKQCCYADHYPVQFNVHDQSWDTDGEVTAVDADGISNG